MSARRFAIVLHPMDNAVRARKVALILSVEFSMVSAFEPALPVAPVLLDAMQPSGSASSASYSMKPVIGVLPRQRSV